VLGIDPGTAVTGYGVVEPAAGRPGHLIECGVIRTSAKQEIWQRLDQLYDGVRGLIERHQPTVLALESVFYSKNVHTTVTLGHARGVAAKPQVGYMVQRLLNLREPPSPNDAADGAAVALTYLLTRRGAQVKAK
jgi:crossover junction endodeoxyribonuclease RuvC